MWKYGNWENEKKEGRQTGKDFQNGSPGLCAIFKNKILYYPGKGSQSRSLNASEYIRQIIINGQFKTQLAEDEWQFARQLIAMANNLNQLAKACHPEGLLQAMVYFESYRNHLDEILGVCRQRKWTFLSECSDCLS